MEAQMVGGTSRLLDALVQRRISFNEIINGLDEVSNAIDVISNRIDNLTSRITDVYSLSSGCIAEQKVSDDPDGYLPKLENRLNRLHYLISLTEKNVSVLDNHLD